MSLHSSFAVALASTTADIYTHAPQSKARTFQRSAWQNVITALTLEWALHPRRTLLLAGFAATVMIVLASSLFAWFGVSALLPLLGEAWSARLAGLGLGGVLGIPALLLAWHRAK